MIPPRHFLDHVIRPVLAVLGAAEARLNTPTAERLLLGTALKESGLTAFEQARGPALSLFQIEPETFDWIFNDVARVKTPRFGYVIEGFLFRGIRPLEQLAGNQHLACAIARLRYWVVKEPLPDADDVGGMARYWGRYYQTKSIPEQIREWERLYQRYAADCFLDGDAALARR